MLTFPTNTAKYRHAIWPAPQVSMTPGSGDTGLWSGTATSTGMAWHGNQNDDWSLSADCARLPDMALRGAQQPTDVWIRGCSGPINPPQKKQHRKQRTQRQRKPNPQREIQTISFVNPPARNPGSPSQTDIDHRHIQRADQRVWLNDPAYQGQNRRIHGNASAANQQHTNHRNNGSIRKTSKYQEREHHDSSSPNKTSMAGSIRKTAKKGIAQHIGNTIGTQNPGNDETGKTGDLRQNDREKTEPRKRCPDQETAENITPPQQARLEHRNIMRNRRPGTANIPQPQKRNQDGAQKCPGCHRKETGPPAKELVNEHGQRNAQHRGKHKPRQDNRRRLPTDGGTNRLDTHRQ